MEEFRTELRTEIQGVRTALRTGIQEGLGGLRTEIQEVRRHSDVVAESLRGEIRLVAEGVAGLDQKFTMEFVKVREEIGEVKTLLQVSYGDLGRRVQALEGRHPSG
ncbi:MAG: hypothetical protein DMF55_10785 [Acidobacteria bacterium]|nr:MAG: hypothetical protein DMF55_10785 [Acidobacteriota bacterium]